MTSSTSHTSRTSSITRAVSISIIASLTGLAGLTGCEKEPSPSDIAPTNPPRPGEAPAPRPGEAPRRDPVPAPSTAPRDQTPPPQPAQPSPTQPGQPAPAQPGPAPQPSQPGQPGQPGQPPAAAADAMTRYLGDVAEGATLLRDVKDASSAGTTAARFTQVADRINTGAATLEALPADQKTRLREQNREALARATSDFRAEADRISGDTALGAALKEAINRVRLFE